MQFYISAKLLFNSLIKVTKILLILIIAASTLTSFSINAHAEEENLFMLISDDTQFSILKEVIQKTGLESNLSKTDGDKYTLLAPSNQAFEKLPKPILENLLKDENKDSLVKLLNLHLLSGSVNGVQIVSSKTLKTLEGSDIDIKLTSSQILLNDKVNLSKIDIKAANGVLHIIDDILVPNSFNIEALSNVATSPAQINSSTPVNENSSSFKVSPATIETPRTGSAFVLPMTLIIFGVIGVGLRFINSPVKVKNS